MTQPAMPTVSIRSMKYSAVSAHWKPDENRRISARRLSSFSASAAGSRSSISARRVIVSDIV